DFRLRAPAPGPEAHGPAADAAPGATADGDTRRQMWATLLKLAQQLDGGEESPADLEWELRSAAKGGAA
ncbi:MAG: hypothetical protein ACRD17_10785, partial [Terriglobales bacterium]